MFNVCVCCDLQRKAAVKEGGEGDGKGAEEKLKRLRKRNAELVALARQLDDKTKSLKLENEQLVTTPLLSAPCGPQSQLPPILFPSLHVLLFAIAFHIVLVG